MEKRKLGKTGQEEKFPPKKKRKLAKKQNKHEFQLKSVKEDLKVIVKPDQDICPKEEEEERKLNVSKKKKRKRDIWGKSISKAPKPIAVKPSSNKEFSSNWKLLASTIGVEKIEPKTKQVDTDDKSIEVKKKGKGPPLEKVKTCLELFNYNHYGGFKTEPPKVPDYYKEPTKCLALDCEMVGIGPSDESTLARVSIVNEFGYCLLDRFVKPKVQVTDFRTKWSGIRREDLVNAKPLEEVIKEVAVLIKDKILVGHALENDFKVLLINHSSSLKRDTSRYLKKGRRPSLKGLAEKYLGLKIQEGEHSSIQDAKATMALYLLHKMDWEKEIKSKSFRIKKNKSKKKKKG